MKEDLLIDEFYKNLYDFLLSHRHLYIFRKFKDDVKQRVYDVKKENMKLD